MDLISINNRPILFAAAEYARRGWPVLPLKPKAKTPLTEHGLLEATTDIEQIAAWWSRWPKANVALRTGIAFDVLDIDGQAGRESLAALAPHYTHTGPVASTGKGWHALFMPTGGRNAANKMPGIDFRGENGYIVAPPSIHPNGHSYRWARDGELPEPTEWLYKILKEPRSTEPSGYPAEDIPSIVEKFDKLFSNYKLQESGTLWKTNCPWHDDSTPSFYLFPENNSFYCFGCNEWGDSLDLETSYKLGYIAPSEIRENRVSKSN